MEDKKKKVYEKPMIAFVDFRTGEITGSPEMVERIKKEAEEAEKARSMYACPFEDTGFPCYLARR